MRKVVFNRCQVNMILDFLKTFNNLSNVFYTQENQIFDILASI